jgi:adenine phosphoribosyltransferase
VRPIARTQTHPLPRLHESLGHARIVDRGGYPYFVHPLTDGVPRVDPALLAEVVEALAARVPRECRLLVTAEAMGIHLTACLGQRLSVPFVVARKRPYRLPGETHADQHTGYGQSTLHLNDVDPGEHVTIVDDVVSTGGTLRALVTALRARGAHVDKILVVLNKDQDLAALGHELDVPIEALATVRVADGRLEVLD